VPNPSFEEYWDCPVGYSDFSKVKFWSKPTNGSSDYYNSCNSNSAGVPTNYMGYQEAHSKNAYVGIIHFGYFQIDSSTWIDGRDYIQCELQNSLVSGKKYNIKFYMSLSDKYIYSVNNIGILFTEASFFISTFSEIPYVPQIDYLFSDSSIMSDKENWIEIDTNYIAQGGEKVLTIGNFRTNANTDTLNTGTGIYISSYYYIDDVSVELDTTVDVSGGEIVEKKNVRVFPNPARSQLTIISNQFSVIGNRFVIFDVIGKEILSSDLKENNQSIDISMLSQGVYYCKIIMGNEIIFSEKVVVIK
jgi:hypothetical protein